MKPILSQSNLERYVILTFSDYGVHVRTYIHHLDRGVVARRFDFFVHGVTCTTLKKSRALSTLLRLLFFPFPYKTIVEVPHSHSMTKVFSLDYVRLHHAQPISHAEVQSFLSQTIWKVLERNKKEMSTKTSLDDLDILLVHNAIPYVVCDEKYFSFDSDDSVFDHNAKSVSFCMAQTFLGRTVYEELKKILPRKATIAYIVEEGVIDAHTLVLKNAMAVLKKESKKSFVSIRIKEKESEVYLYDGSSLRYYDALPWGYSFVHRALHDAYCIDEQTSYELIKTIGTDAFSKELSLAMEAVVKKEFAVFHKLVEGLKKSIGAKTVVYVDTGLLSTCVAYDPKFSKYKALPVIEKLDTVLEFDASVTPSQSALLFWTMLYSKKGYATKLATQLIRWLMP